MTTESHFEKSTSVPLHVEVQARQGKLCVVFVCVVFGWENSFVQKDSLD
jgi:hypothetical protein